MKIALWCGRELNFASAPKKEPPPEDSNGRTRDSLGALGRPGTPPGGSRGGLGGLFLVDLEVRGDPLGRFWTPRQRDFMFFLRSSIASAVLTAFL